MLRALAETYIAAIVTNLVVAAVSPTPGPMTAYMRHRFPFLGVKALAQKALARAAEATGGPPTDEGEVTAAVDALEGEPGGSGQAHLPPGAWPGG